MTINRRRAPSSKISSEKKLGGHMRERNYATLIGGEPLGGTQKADVKDRNGKFHSVKSGNKWQVFLYGYDRICSSRCLNILQPCLDAFPEDYSQYVKDREACIGFKEGYIKAHGRDAARNLSNAEVSKRMGPNKYIEAKSNLAKATPGVCEALNDKDCLRAFLGEALFNNDEVEFLAIKDSTHKKDNLFKVFEREEVLDILSDRLFPAESTAGRVPEDYNVPGQKTLLRYQEASGKFKNIVEIEIRNDSAVHYRQVRFNMYSKDTLRLLLGVYERLPSYYVCEHVVAYGQAEKEMRK